MTIADEISRLQTAKADAKTSIINKWVNVPDSAKLDTYHTYIDQIQQWWWATGKYTAWMVLRSQMWSAVDRTYTRFGHNMTYVDNDVMILCHPYKVQDPGSSGTRHTLMLEWYMLDGSVMDFNKWYTNDSIWDAPSFDYLSYHCGRYTRIVNWELQDIVWFSLNYRIITTPWWVTHSTYKTMILSYNITTRSREYDSRQETSDFRLDNTWDMNIYTPSFESAWIWNWIGMCMKWTPVSSS